MYYIIRNGKWFCKDNCFREFSAFGTPSWAIKTYRRETAAVKRAKAMRATVIAIPQDGQYSVECSMRVIKRTPCDDKPGFENVVNVPIMDFAVKGTRPEDYEGKTLAEIVAA